MKKVTTLVGVLMFAVAAWAYQGSYGSSTKASTPAKTTASTTKSTTTKAAAGPKESTMTGCLSGPDADGDYLLKNGTYRKGMEVAGMDDLKAHVGHKVKLTGTWVKESPEAEAKEAKGKKGEKEADEKQFKASKVAMIAETCTAPKAATTKTK